MPEPPPLTSDPADLIVIGEVSGAHGVRGAVRVAPVTDFPDHLLTLERVIVVRGRTGWPTRVERAWLAGQHVVMKLAGVETPEDAAALRGATVRIPPTEVHPLPPGQFYIFQIVGLHVRTPEGQALGEVTEVLQTGSNDVYVVRTPDGKDLLLPATDEVIQTIDVAAGQMVARPPEWM
jgi:16S rRNA processing protein RimM